MNINLYWESQHHSQAHLQQSSDSEAEKHHDPHHVPHQHLSKQQYLPQSHLPFKCEYCDVTFCTEQDLSHHQLLHSRRKPFLCEICGARFPYNSILIWHKKMHNGQLPFKCDECDAQFQQNSVLVWHKRKHRISSDLHEGNHTDNHIIETSNSNHLFYHQDPTFQPIPPMPTMFSVPNILNGPICGQSVSTSSTFPQRNFDSTISNPYIAVDNHPCANIITSDPVNVSKMNDKGKMTDDKTTLRCDICSATFNNCEYLKSHIQEKHNTGQNNPYYQINTSNSLAWHNSVLKRKNYSDKQFKCDLCGAGFKLEGHLKTHRLKHTVEKPYKCKHCGLSFTDNFLLEFHERRHQTDRPYKCARCGAAFFRDSLLQKHMQRHSGKIFL